MPTDNEAAWDRYSATYQEEADLPTDVAHYGPDIPTERDLRLLGDLKGKRVLELGCGGAQNSVAFARAGAMATGVDISSEQLAHARRLAERADVKLELRQGDLADLAFLRPDSFDAVFSAYAFGYVEDLGRVFRQAHRVLKVGAPLVFSLAHPAWVMVDEDSANPVTLNRSYFDPRPLVYQRGDAEFVEYHHSFAGLYTALARASYRVDMVVEPEPVGGGVPRSRWWRDAFAVVPRTLIIRARKEGN